jgi:hypothetical protein
MSVTAWVPTAQLSQQLLVHKNAVLRNEAGPYVYVVRQGPDGAARALPAAVQVLFALEERFAVRSSDLREGDLVVVEGNERLFPMMQVNPSRAVSRAEGALPEAAASLGSKAALTRVAGEAERSSS